MALARSWFTEQANDSRKFATTILGLTFLAVLAAPVSADAPKGWNQLHGNQQRSWTWPGGSIKGFPTANKTMVPTIVNLNYETKALTMVSSAFDNEGNIWISFSGKEDPMDDPHDARPATEAEPMPFDEFYDAELYKYSPNGTVVCSTPGSLGQSGGPPHYDPELDLVFWGGRDQSNGAVVTPDCNTAAELTCYTRGGIEVWPGAGADGYVRLGENVYSTCGAALSFWQRLNENNSDWRMFHEQFYPVHEDYSAVEFGGLSTDGELLFVSSAASSWYAVQPTSNQTRLLALNAATGLKKWEVNWQYSSPNPCQAGIPVSAPKQSMVLFAHDSPTVVSGISTVSGSIKWNWTVESKFANLPEITVHDESGIAVINYVHGEEQVQTLRAVMVETGKVVWSVNGYLYEFPLEVLFLGGDRLYTPGQTADASTGLIGQIDVTTGKWLPGMVHYDISQMQFYGGFFVPRSSSSLCTTYVTANSVAEVDVPGDDPGDECYPACLVCFDF